MSFEMLNLAWQVAGLKAGAKIVLVALADRHNGKTGACWARQAELAAQCGMSRRSLDDQLKTLLDRGLIRLLVTNHNDGNKVTRFTLFPEPEDAALPLDAPEQSAKSAQSKVQNPHNAKCKIRQTKVQNPSDQSAEFAHSYKEEPEINRNQTGSVAPACVQTGDPVDGNEGDTAVMPVPSPLPVDWLEAAGRDFPDLDLPAIAAEFVSHWQAERARSLAAWRQVWLRRLKAVQGKPGWHRRAQSPTAGPTARASPAPQTRRQPPRQASLHHGLNGHSRDTGPFPTTLPPDLPDDDPHRDER